LALTLAAARREGDLKHVAALRAQCVEALSNKLDAIIHGDPDCVSPYVLNFAVPGIRSDALINQTAAEIAIASGSACSSGAFEPSSVLRAMGVVGDSLYGAVRMSFDRSHTEDDIATAVEAITAAVQRMRMLDA
jgi:cysteine desulfurase